MNDKMRCAAVCWQMDRFLELWEDCKKPEDEESIAPIYISSGMDMKDTFYQGFKSYWSDDYNAANKVFNRNRKKGKSVEDSVKAVKDKYKKSFNNDENTWDSYEDLEVYNYYIPKKFDELNSKDQERLEREAYDKYMQKCDEMAKKCEHMTATEIFEKCKNDPQVCVETIYRLMEQSICQRLALRLEFDFLMPNQVKNVSDVIKTLKEFFKANDVSDDWFTHMDAYLSKLENEQKD